jgi:uncharacterized Zn finger protein (UPF0148 family)
MKFNRKKLAKQSDLQWLIQRDAHVNLVDCGNCGSVLLHKVGVDDIECPFCGFTSDPCDFPDHFYDGFEDSGEFDSM